jgi:hypothetical protein
MAEQLISYGATRPGRDERRAQGKKRRDKCSRAAHARTILGRGNRDPVALIEASNHDRWEHLVPVRHGRMLESLRSPSSAARRCCRRMIWRVCPPAASRYMPAATATS